MSRPLRIEYPDACYHVMNRGASHRTIFQDEEQRALFLALLEDMHTMFDIEIHAYCLMDNHYHLLLQTPQGNLQRAMRHLNGVYTQRINRRMNTDGSLFRGRYKAILVDVDAYLLQVSRYIHLNPVVAGLTDKPEQYPWSSYPAYLGEVRPPKWLSLKPTLSMVANRQQRKHYQAFVEAGLDDDTQAFFDKKRTPPIFGSESFQAQMFANIDAAIEIPASRQRPQTVTLEIIAAAVAQSFAVTHDDITASKRGRGASNPARAALMMIARREFGLPLAEIGTFLGLNHYGSVSGAVSRFEKALQEDKSLKRKYQLAVKLINNQT